MTEAVITKEITHLKDLFKRKNIFLVTDEILYSLYGDRLAGSRAYIMESGEAFKTLKTVEEILASMTTAGCDRKTTLIAVGGGVVGDTAGFAASIFMRGIKWVNVPTTLLAQVDSGIGGKTGVDVDSYKNIAGSFWMPDEVHICTDFLKTLPTREWICGMGEVVKHAAISADVYDFVSRNFDALLAHKEDTVPQAITLNVRYKEGIVKADFKEAGLRKRLNAGHTIGHAIEKLDRFKMSHGKYVAAGLQIEMKMFEELIEPDFFNTVTAMANRICPDKFNINPEEIVATARADKKNSEGKISFLVPTSKGEVAEHLIDAKETVRRLKNVR